MKKSSALVLAALVTAGFAVAVPQFALADPVAAPKEKSVYDFKMKSLAGQDVDLSKYKGKVLLIVNTASKCGNTPQYAALEKLSETYRKQGLEILGFPANNFGSQEPGSNEEIGAFCTKNYGVTFDMFSKISVKGADKAPLYTYLTEEANPQFKGDVTWNFEKFLISRDGKLVGRFTPKTQPGSPEVVAAIEHELKAGG